MRPRGEDIATSVRDWLKEDIKKGPSSKYELGRFFGVSTTTLSLFATLLKFAVEDPVLDRLTVTCFGTLYLSAITALYMAKPYFLRVTQEFNLYKAYNRIVRSTEAPFRVGAAGFPWGAGPHPGRLA